MFLSLKSSLHLWRCPSRTPRKRIKIAQLRNECQELESRTTASKPLSFEQGKGTGKDNELQRVLLAPPPAVPCSTVAADAVRAETAKLLREAGKTGWLELRDQANLLARIRYKTYWSLCSFVWACPGWGASDEAGGRKSDDCDRPSYCGTTGVGGSQMIATVPAVLPAATPAGAVGSQTRPAPSALPTSTPSADAEATGPT
eukprot:s1340_g2.t2